MGEDMSVEVNPISENNLSVFVSIKKARPQLFLGKTSLLGFESAHRVRLETLAQALPR